MEPVSSTAPFAVRSAAAPRATPGKCLRARAGQITSLWRAARSTSTCACIGDWPKKTLISSVRAHTTISSIRSRKSGVCAKPKPPSAGFTVRLLPANPGTSQPFGPTDMNQNHKSAASFSNASMKNTLGRDGRRGKKLRRGRCPHRALTALSVIPISYRSYTDFGLAEGQTSLLINLCTLYWNYYATGASNFFGFFRPLERMI